MCMLCVIPPNVIPSEDKLIASALNNPHGFGFAILVPSENRIIHERTMNPDESIERFLMYRRQYTESFAMWHARFATLGETTVDNCHPFMVGNDPLTYLGHNGHLPIVEPKGDTRSDTRIFAEDLLPRIGGVSSLDNEQVYNLIEDFTSGSKVCVLTLNPDAEQNCYLIHEEKGNIDDDGVWWSNDSCSLDYYKGLYDYRTPSKYYGSAYIGKAKDYMFEEDDDGCGAGTLWECPSCRAMLDLYDDDDMCQYCQTCLWCSSSADSCLCMKEPEYAPKKPNIDKYGGWYVS